MQAWVSDDECELEVIATCPHCSVNNAQVRIEATGDWSEIANCYLATCLSPDCQGSVFFLRDVISEELQSRFRSKSLSEPRVVYPLGNESVIQNDAVPTHVTRELVEADVCFKVGAFLAAMTMARRVLQRCLKEQGHSERNLVDQIKSAKKDGTIPKRYHALADEIRHYGNIGAHPDDDKLACISDENAKSLVGFVKLLIEEFYILPKKAEQLRQRRTER